MLELTSLRWGPRRMRTFTWYELEDRGVVCTICKVLGSLYEGLERWGVE
jgi:hypothetical protein